MAKKKVRKAVSKRKPVKKVKRIKRAKPMKRKVASRARKAVPKRKSKPKKQHVIKQVERSSVERTLAGKKHHRKRYTKRNKRRRVVMAGRGTRRRSVGKKGGSFLLVGLGLGALALYLFTRPKTTTTYPTYPQLPPLNQTSNYQRNDQTSSILNYALAAGIAADAIYKLIDRLNSSSDTEVQNIYDHVETTGDVGVYV